jgi:hypothetical protein
MKTLDTLLKNIVTSERWWSASEHWPILHRQTCLVWILICVNEMLFISLFQLSNHLKCTHSLLIILYLISFWYIKKIFF